MVFSGRYLLGGASGPELHSLQRVSHLASAVATVVGVTQAKVAIVVVAPTLDLKTTIQQVMMLGPPAKGPGAGMGWGWVG